jgi:prephenate dehydrogenase
VKEQGKAIHPRSDDKGSRAGGISILVSQVSGSRRALHAADLIVVAVPMPAAPQVDGGVPPEIVVNLWR